MKANLKQGLFYFFPVLFSFCLPFGGLLLSFIIIAWGLVSFLNIEKPRLLQGFRNRNLWLLFAFFILTAISAFFSENKEEAAFAVEIKLAFIFLPYYIFCFAWPKEVIKKMLLGFVSGCFFACLVLLARASWYGLQGDTGYFFYTSFSWFIHASYFAMYLILALAIVFIYFQKWFAGQRMFVFLSTLYILIFTATIFLCESKMGIISFFVCLPLICIYKWRNFFTGNRIIMLFAGLLVIVCVMLWMFPGAFGRLNAVAGLSLDALDKTSAESTTVRILIWEQCIQIIESNFLFGVEVGDANDALFAAYRANGLTGALEHRLNAHNQYFQTFIGLGLAGFALIVIFTFGALGKGLFNHVPLLAIFSLLIVLNFLVESMLQTSAGNLFFVFFYSLFNRKNINAELE